MSKTRGLTIWLAAVMLVVEAVSAQAQTVPFMGGVFTAPAASSGGGGGVTDHGDLDGLADDDHAQYPLLDGTRSFTLFNVDNLRLDGNTISTTSGSLLLAPASNTVTVVGTWNLENNNIFTTGGTTGTPQITRAAGSATVPVYTFLSDSNTGMGRAAADQLSLIAGGLELARLDGNTNGNLIAAPNGNGDVRLEGETVVVPADDFALTIRNESDSLTGFRFYTIGGDAGLEMNSSGNFCWSSTSNASGTKDVCIRRTAAGALEQRVTTQAQSYRLYRTFTDASNYERMALQSGAGYFEIAAETAGTGTDNIDVRLTPSGTGGVTTDNLRLDGNTISTTNANGALVIAPNGTGNIRGNEGTKDAPTYSFAGGPTTGIFRDGFGDLGISGAGTHAVQVSGFAVGLASGIALNWRSGSLPSSSIDIGLARDAAGVLRVTNGSTGLGNLLHGRLVEANTAGSGAPNVLTCTESGKIITNEGATAKNYNTLPAAAAGCWFTLVVQDSDGLRATADTGDTIRLGAAVSAAAGFCESTTIGDSATVVAINATEWVATSLVGIGWSCT